MNAVITTLVLAEGVSLTLISFVLWRQGRRARNGATSETPASAHLARIQAQQPEVDAMTAKLDKMTPAA